MWKIKLTKLLFEKCYVIAIIQKKKKKKMTPKTRTVNEHTATFSNFQNVQINLNPEAHLKDVTNVREQTNKHQIEVRG